MNCENFNILPKYPLAGIVSSLRKLSDEGEKCSIRGKLKLNFYRAE
jgi:hypothetical protein